MDGRHFVRHGNTFQIIDFSTAKKHRCRNATPFLIQNSQDAPRGCQELIRLEVRFGILSGETRVC
jgi:hypothetical protein